MPETSQERTEEATPRRKQQARRKGTVTKSVDLNNALVLFALILVMPAAASRMGEAFMTIVNTGFTNLPTDVRPETVTRFASTLAQPALMALALILGAALVVGLASNFAQVGFVLSGEALMPNLNKLNPANGLKRLFSFSATFDGLKAAAKAGLFMYLAWTSVAGNWPQITSLGGVTPTEALITVGQLLHSIAIKIAVVWLAIAGLDYFFQKKQVNKQLMMTKEELKQEMKEGETSAELKQAQAARRRKMSKGRMMDAVKTANVVVTNPTHYAIALKYDPEKGAAPVVVAKGQDFLAAKIREAAAAHRIPIVPNPPLARAIYKRCEIGDYIPRELFQSVAEVLAFVYKTLQGVKPQ